MAENIYNMEHTGQELDEAIDMVIGPDATYADVSDVDATVNDVRSGVRFVGSNRELQVGTLNISAAGSSWYGICDTAASTAAKEVEIEDFPEEYSDGLQVCILFSNAQSASNPTLNINSIGAKNINISSTTQASSGEWGSGVALDLVYSESANSNNGAFICIDKSHASTDTYGEVKLSSATNSTSNELAATSSAVKAAYDLANTANTLAGTASTAAGNAIPKADINTGTLDTSSNVKVPSSKLVSDTFVAKSSVISNLSNASSNSQVAGALTTKNAIDGINSTLQSTVSTSLIDTSISSSSTDGHIPSSKAVYDVEQDLKTYGITYSEEDKTGNVITLDNWNVVKEITIPIDYKQEESDNPPSPTNKRTIYVPRSLYISNKNIIGFPKNGANPSSMQYIDNEDGSIIMNGTGTSSSSSWRNLMYNNYDGAINVPTDTYLYLSGSVLDENPVSILICYMIEGNDGIQYITGTTKGKLKDGTIVDNNSITDHQLSSSGSVIGGKFIIPSFIDLGNETYAKVRKTFLRIYPLSESVFDNYTIYPMLQYVIDNENIDTTFEHSSELISFLNTGFGHLLTGTYEYISGKFIADGLLITYSGISNETWTKRTESISSGNAAFITPIPFNLKPWSVANDNFKGLSNMFVRGTGLFSTTSAYTWWYTGNGAVGSGGNIAFIVHTSTASTAEEWRTWLDSNNLQIWVPLNVPVEIQLLNHSLNIGLDIFSIRTLLTYDASNLSSITITDYPEFNIGYYTSGENKLVPGTAILNSITDDTLLIKGQSADAYVTGKKLKELDNGFAFASELVCVRTGKSEYLDGTWSMNDYTSSSSAPWSSYKTYINKIIIREYVTNIANYAFFNYSVATKIYIPSTVTSIGDYAFNGCTAITDIYYEGKQADWNNITIGSNQSTAFTNATIHYESLLYPKIISQPKSCYVSSGTISFDVLVDGEIDFSQSVDMDPSDYVYSYQWERSDDGIIWDNVSDSNNYKNLPHFEFSKGSITYDKRLYRCIVKFKSGAETISSDDPYGVVSSVAASIYTSSTISASGTGWSLDSNGVLTVTSMSDYTEGTAPWYSNRNNIIVAKIGDSVTKIGNYAFYNCNYLRYIDISKSVLSIGEYAVSDSVSKILYNDTEEKWNTVTIGNNNTIFDFVDMMCEVDPFSQIGFLRNYSIANAYGCRDDNFVIAMINNARDTFLITRRAFSRYGSQSMCITPNGFIAVGEVIQTNGVVGSITEFSFNGEELSGRHKLMQNVIGHGNDCCYNPITNQIYICNSGIRVIDYNTLEYVKYYTRSDNSTLYPTGIAFDNVTNILYGRNGTTVFKININESTSSFSTTTIGNMLSTTDYNRVVGGQGMAAHNGIAYFMVNTHNQIVKFDLDEGKVLENIIINDDSSTTPYGEIEGVDFLTDQLYILSAVWSPEKIDFISTIGTSDGGSGAFQLYKTNIGGTVVPTSPFGQGIVERKDCYINYKPYVLGNTIYANTTYKPTGGTGASFHNVQAACRRIMMLSHNGWGFTYTLIFGVGSASDKNYRPINYANQSIRLYNCNCIINLNGASVRYSEFSSANITLKNGTNRFNLKVVDNSILRLDNVTIGGKLTATDSTIYIGSNVNVQSWNVTNCEIHYVDSITSVTPEMIGSVERDYIATKNYSSGDLIIIANKLYKATSSITSGSTLEPTNNPTNIVETTISSLLQSL